MGSTLMCIVHGHHCRIDHHSNNCTELCAGYAVSGPILMEVGLINTSAHRHISGMRQWLIQHRMIRISGVVNSVRHTVSVILLVLVLALGRCATDMLICRCLNYLMLGPILLAAFNLP